MGIGIIFAVAIQLVTTPVGVVIRIVGAVLGALLVLGIRLIGWTVQFAIWLAVNLMRLGLWLSDLAVEGSHRSVLALREAWGPSGGRV